MSSNELTAIAQKAARGGLFLFIGYTCSVVIQAVSVIIVARLLGPSSYGLYTLAIVFPMLLVSLSDAGMNSAIVRLPARLKAEGNFTRASRLIRLGILLKLAISSAASVICYISATVIAVDVMNRPELTPYLQIASLLIVFQALVDATMNSFIGQDLMQYSAAVQITWATLKGTLAPILVAMGFGIAGALYSYVFALAAAGLMGTMILFTRYARSLGHADESALTDLHALLRYGLPLYVAGTSSIFLIQYQNILLARVASNVEVGNFGATWNFTQFMMILLYPMMTAMFPMFSKVDLNKQRGDIARAFVLAVKYTSLFIVPASIAMMIFSPELIYLTYGGSYELAPQYLVLLAAVYLLTTISYQVVGTFLNGVADTGTVVKISIVTLVVYLPMAPALAWFYGPYGLLAAYALSNAASTTYAVCQVSLKFEARPDLKASGRILLAATVAAIPTVSLIRLDGLGVSALNLMAGGLLYLVAYVTMVPILRAVDRQDISNLRKLTGSTRLVTRILSPILDYEVRIISAIRRT